MFGVDTSELLIVALAALIFIGPKELPGAMRMLGRWIGKARGHARHFTSGIENMMREAELEEMEKRWREENERIMREHPMGAVPYAGASTGEAAGGSSLSFGSSGQADDATTSSRSSGAASNGYIEEQQFVPGHEEARTPPQQSLSDEPPLPLPDPDHHRRELP
jgi:sec-independent protein translocase protein TatB